MYFYGGAKFKEVYSDYNTKTTKLIFDLFIAAMADGVLYE
jgi:hypothetical protein